jgi:ABC-2 type transport system ATP-binding protein
VLDVVGLSDVAKKGPGKFSLGMSQRLGIAAAILGKPKYLMLDEPANGLDPEGIAWLRDFLKDYAKQGSGVFVSSHLLSEMSLMADNLVVLGKGKLIASAPVEQILAGASSSVFVRGSSSSKLANALKSAGLNYKKQDSGFTVSGVKTDLVGKVAFAAKVPVLELVSHTASLEEAFLEMTEGSQEYKAKPGGKK